MTVRPEIKSGDKVRITGHSWSNGRIGATDCLVRGRWKVWGGGECLGFFPPNELDLIDGETVEGAKK